MPSALNEIQVARLDTQLLKGIRQEPSADDVSQFNSMIGNTKQNAIAQLVSRAEDQLVKVELGIGNKLQSFSADNAVFDLVSAMHESGLRSVSIQLTGKVGSKSAEGFEQLVKQQ